MVEENKMHRVFVAVEFPDEVIKEVARVQQLLGNLKFTGKMTELENLHLTLKFLGEIDERKMKEVGRKLREVRFDSFDAYLESVGSFGRRGDPRIIWIKIGGKGIFELQKKADEVLTECGFKKEERFMSHMTLARIKYTKDKKGFHEYVKNIGLKNVKFKFDRFKLKESELRESGPLYRDFEVYNSI